MELIWINYFVFFDELGRNIFAYLHLKHFYMISYKYFFILFISVLLFSCQDSSGSNKKVSKLNLELSKEIDKMANADQQMQLNILRFMTADIEEYEKVEKTRDQVYEKHANRVSEILDEYGYPNYNLVGKKSSDNFYTLVAHSSDFPEIKKKAISKWKQVLNKDKEQLSMYAQLVDQTALEQNELMEYGTVVRYQSNGQSYVENLKDSLNVDSRRIELGLDSLKHYMNAKTVDYFVANQESLLELGVTRPIFYK